MYHGSLGHDSQDLIKYLEGEGSTKCPPDANPAEFMLEVIGAGDPNYKGKDWGDVWANSSAHAERSREIEEMIESRKHVEPSKNLKDDREYAMPLSVQTATVVRRAFVSYWANPQLHRWKDDSAHHDRSVQLLHLLSPRLLHHRLPIPPLLRLHDPHHLSTSDPTTPAGLPQ